jgi:hypothetical protein
MLAAFLRDLSQPEYVHVLLNALPVYGLAVAIPALIIALWQRSRPAQIVALWVTLLAAGSALPTAHYGEEAYDRVLSMTDEPGAAWLEAHAHAADYAVWPFYICAVVCVGGIVAPKKWPRTATPLTATALMLAIISIGAGAYLGYTGGKIRHREFRTVPPPPRAQHTDEH